MLEIRRGLRYSLSPGAFRTDLDGWVTLMHRLYADGISLDIKLAAAYELTIAQHRGKGDLRPVEHIVRRYVQDVLEAEDPTILFDASLVIQTMGTAAVSGLTDIPLSESLSWIPPLRNHLDRLLEATDCVPNQRAGLLQAAAHLGMHMDLSGVEPTNPMSLDAIDEAHLMLTQAVESGSLQQHIGTAPLLDIDYAMSRLCELVDVMRTAPPYPLDEFATLIDLLTPSLRDHHLYRRVCDGIDEAIQRQAGAAAVAERCRQRAFSLLAVDRPLEALHELHEAKTNWFHGDTLRESLHAIGVIYQIYDYLGMHFAAKRYALGLAMLAQKSPDPYDRSLVPRAIFSASISDHNAGAWISSAELASIASLAHMAYTADAFDLGNHDYVLEAAARQVITATTAQQLRPKLLGKFNQIFEGNPIANLIGAGVDEILGEQNLQSEEAVFDLLRDDVGLPFSDIGPERFTTFQAHGIAWSVHGRNDAETNIAIEDFCSTLQILLVEIASDDAVIIPGEVDIEIILSNDPDEQEDVQTRTENGQRHWRCTVRSDPPADRLAEFRIGMYSSAFIVLQENSLLDEDQFAMLMDRAAGTGLFNKFEIGHRSYRHLATFRSESPPLLNEPSYKPIARPSAVAAQRCSPHLDARADPGPSYTPEYVQSILDERYELLPLPIRYTLPELMRDPKVQLLFQELKEQDGWKDWHLMSVVMNLTVNHRITAKYGPLTEQNWIDHADEVHSESLRAELVGDTRIDPSLIARTSMELGIIAVAISSLRRWGLDLPHPPPNSSAVMHVLAVRYGFWDDDIPHQDPFRSTHDH